MNQLPGNRRLPINLLAGCFNNTTATYKFYWLLSILQSVEENKEEISKKELFARMISNAWFTVNYFHVSFGKQDKLQRAIEVIKDYELLMVDDDREKIFQKLIKTTNQNTLKQLRYFNNQVPHWFLSPWFPKLTGEKDAQRERRINVQSQNFTKKSLYALFDEVIKINPEWKHYLTQNVRILKDYCYWNLAMFLQVKNPNVPDIPNKLIRPASRNNLTQQRVKFWDLVVSELGRVKCIYTGKELTVGNYAVEHFIPYSFVSHDLIWNLIPADKSFNCSKSDKLPRLIKYFDQFYNLQKQAIEIVRRRSPRNKFLEDYLTIFSDLEAISNLPENFTKEKFKKRLQPLITIASNNGFEFLK